MQQTDILDLGEIKVAGNKATMFVIPNIGTSLAVMIYDIQNRVGGIAHIVLPESSLSTTPYTETIPGKYADVAIPRLLEMFTEAGGQKRYSNVRMVGGAQLFNFGGGAGNLLNIGARNATAVRAAMSKQGLGIEKADTGGNKGKSLRFIVATGEIYVQQIGGNEYLL